MSGLSKDRYEKTERSFQSRVTETGIDDHDIFLIFSPDYADYIYAT